MSEKRPASLLLFDILESINKIENYTQDITFEQLMLDERTKDAILRNIQIIGEASKHIPAQLVSTTPDIDWSGISGMHRYHYPPVFPGRLALAQRRAFMKNSPS